MSTVEFPEIFNNGLTLLSGAISDSATSIDVDSALALGLDNSTTDAYVTIIAPSTFGFNPFLTPETLEVIQVTAVSGDTLTVTRGVDGTTGVEFGDNAYVMTRNNAATLQRVYDALTDGTDSLNIDSILIGGDSTVSGDRLLGATGVDKTWSHFIPASAISLAATNPAGALVVQVMASGDTEIAMIPFDASTNELVTTAFIMPDDYDGSNMTIDLYWTALSGTGAVDWSFWIKGFTHDDDLTVAHGFNSFSTATLTALNDLQITTATKTISGSVVGGELVTLLLQRAASAGSDTLNADAQLIGIKLSYT